MQPLQKKLFYTTVVVAVIILVFVFFFSQTNQEARLIKKECEDSGGNFRGSACLCQDVFTVYNATSLRCEGAFGEQTASAAEVERFRDRKQFADRCYGSLRDVYVVPNTPITFCFDPEWGAPVVHEGVQVAKTQGTTFHVQFLNGVESATAPILWYYTDAVLFTEESATVPFCFSCVKDRQTLSEQKEALGLAEYTTVEDTVLGTQAALLFLKKAQPAATYLVPKAFGDFHLQILLPKGQTDSTDLFIKSIWFDDML